MRLSRIIQIHLITLPGDKHLPHRENPFKWKTMASNFYIKLVHMGGFTNLDHQRQSSTTPHKNIKVTWPVMEMTVTVVVEMALQFLAYHSQFSHTGTIGVNWKMHQYEKRLSYIT